MSHTKPLASLTNDLHYITCIIHIRIIEIDAVFLRGPLSVVLPFVYAVFTLNQAFRLAVRVPRSFGLDPRSRFSTGEGGSESKKRVNHSACDTLKCQKDI